MWACDCKSRGWIANLVKKGIRMSKTAAAKKMPKAQRREQLMETALEIVRTQGTDALTLGYLAERAGVSKPIAYEHFGTRSGLLIALYQQLDQQQVDDLLAALEQAPKQLASVARLMSEAYMACYRSIGPEWHAISAALKGDEELSASGLGADCVSRSKSAKAAGPPMSCSSSTTAIVISSIRRKSRAT